MFSYNRGDYAWESAEELIAASSLSFREIQATIDPFSASDELFSHIFFEAYLKLYEGDRALELGIARGKEAASGNLPETKISDWTPLFEYCDARFKSTPLEQLLTIAYMFRLPLLKQMPAVLLSNAKLVPFLSSLPIEIASEKAGKDDRSSDKDRIDRDVIAWEFFRQLTPPRLDPIGEETVNRIRELVDKHPAEIAALRRRCFGGMIQARSIPRPKINKLIKLRVPSGFFFVYKLHELKWVDPGQERRHGRVQSKRNWFLFKIKEGCAGNYGWMPTGVGKQ